MHAYMFHVISIPQVSPTKPCMQLSSSPYIFYTQQEMLACTITHNRAMCRSTAINITEMTVPNTEVPELRTFLTGGYWSTFSIATVYRRYINYIWKLILFLTRNWSRDCVDIVVIPLLVGQPRSHGSTPGGVKGFFCHLDRVDDLWDKPNLLFDGYQGVFWDSTDRVVKLPSHVSAEAMN
jgi:hypothetical protein